MGYNAPQDAILPLDYDWQDRSLLEDALTTLTNALRPWTIDFHVAQNDATVRGSGSHDKTGRHCLATDPNGKLDIAHDAGYWLRDPNDNPTDVLNHICWDGCMFPNEVMMKPQTWNDILAAMVAVRDAHGWGGSGTEETEPGEMVVETVETITVTEVERPPRKVAKAKSQPKRKIQKKPKKAAPKAKAKAKRSPARKAPRAKAKKAAKKPKKKTRR